MGAAVALGDPTILAVLATTQAESLVLRGHVPEAWTLIDDAIANLEAHGLRHQLPGLWAQLAISSIGVDQLRLDEAVGHLAEDSDVPARILFAAVVSAACSLDGADPGEARRATEAAVEIARLVDDLWLVSEQLRVAGLAALPEDPVRAEALLHEALTLAVDHGFEPSAVGCLDGLAASKAARGLDLDAARLFGATGAGVDRLGIVRPGASVERSSPTSSTSRPSRLGARAFADAAAEGARLSLTDAVGHARGSRGARGRPASGWASLTPTEERVVALVRQGLTNPQISVELFVSAGTVKSHLLPHLPQARGLDPSRSWRRRATVRLREDEPGSVTPPR